MDFRPRRLAGLLILCAFAPTARAAVGASAHPITQVLMSNLALRESVRRDLPRAAEIAAKLEPGQSLTVDQAALLTLVTHRAEIPSWQVSEVLGAEAAKKLAAVTLDEETLAVLRESLDVDDVAEKLAGAFDNDRSEWSPLADRRQAFVVSDLPMGATVSVYDPEKRRARAASETHERLSAAALAPATPFLSQGRFHPKEGEGFPDAILEKGTVKDHPAVRVTLPDHTTYVAVQVGLAKTWDAARAAAKALGPSWDLPTTGDYFPLVVSTALDLRLVVGRSSWPDAAADQAIYPLWTRFADEGDNARFKGAARLYTMRDGAGMDHEFVDIDAKTLDEGRRALADFRHRLAAGQHRTAAEEERLRQALADHHKRTGSSLNPHIQHDELPADVNAIIEKPSRGELEVRVAAISRALEAFGNGYPVYAVRKFEKR